MSHSNELLPKPVNIGFTSFVCGIFLCGGIALLGNPYFMVPIAGIYFFGGLTYPGAMWGQSLIIQEKVSRVYFIQGIGWNPLWFLPMVMRLSKPVFMGKRQLTLKQNYVCLDKYAIEFEGILMVRTINPAGTVLLEHDQHAVNHQLEETMEAAARPYIADVSGMDLWKGSEDTTTKKTHKQSIEEGIENHIKKHHPGYDHDDKVLGELGQEVLHITVVKLEPPKTIQVKWQNVHEEDIERQSEEKNMNTVIALLGKFADEMKKRQLNLDAKTLLDRFQAERKVVNVAISDQNINLSAQLDEGAATVLSGLLNKGVKLDPATQAALIAAIASAMKGKK